LLHLRAALHFSGRLHPEIELADQVIVVELGGRSALKGDLAVHDDVAAVGDAATPLSPLCLKNLERNLEAERFGGLAAVLPALLSQKDAQVRSRPNSTASWMVICHGLFDLSHGRPLS